MGTGLESDNASKKEKEKSEKENEKDEELHQKLSEKKVGKDKRRYFSRIVCTCI